MFNCLPGAMLTLGIRTNEKRALAAVLFSRSIPPRRASSHSLFNPAPPAAGLTDFCLLPSYLSTPMASTPFFSSSFVHRPGRWRKPVRASSISSRRPPSGARWSARDLESDFVAARGARDLVLFRIHRSGLARRREKIRVRSQKTEVRSQPRHRRRRIEQPVTKRRRRRRRTACGRNFDGGGGY